MPIYECDLCEACPPEPQEEWLVGEDSDGDLEFLRFLLFLIESRSLRQTVQSMGDLRTNIRDTATSVEELDDAEEPDEPIPYLPIEDPEETEMDEPYVDNEDRGMKQGQEIESNLEQPLRT
jgi:hypothetical protein